MENTEKGKLIISAAKSLKRFQVGDATIAALLYATSFAGRAGLFASALRHQKNISYQRAGMLAAEEGFTPPELTGQIIPWLENSGLCSVRRQDGQIRSIASLVSSTTGS